jgi:type II secretory pathway component GspD/PulD (secretin)
LHRIPVVRELTGMTTTGGASSSMFIFIRPIILQDDKFRDLRYVSEESVRNACVPRDYPTAHPVWMR